MRRSPLPSFTTSGGAEIAGVAHGYVGAGILEKEGVDSVVVEIVSGTSAPGSRSEETRDLADFQQGTTYLGRPSRR